jgi:hypothetical protein
VAKSGAAATLRRRAGFVDGGGGSAVVTKAERNSLALDEIRELIK